jgi:hypothetical protein
MNNKETTSTHPKDIQYVWGLISQSSAIDEERNNISLFNVIDQISVSSEGFAEDSKTKVNMPHEISLTWRRTVGLSLVDRPVSFGCRIELVDPTGDVLEQVTKTFKLQENSRRTRQRIRVDGFVITEPGDYVYRVKTKEDDDDDFQTVNEIPFEVHEQT